MSEDRPAVKEEDYWANISAAHQPLHGAVTDSLREAILKGWLKPGQRLRESRLAQMFAVSRNPVREALRALEAEGIVEISPRKGARVRQISAAEAAEIIELRAELEGINARHAAKRCDDETRRTLGTLLEDGNRAVRVGDADQLKAFNDRFHVLLASAGGNRYRAEYVRTLRERTLWLFAAASQERVTETWKEHADILRAVISGDDELAALLASRHVRQVGERILSHLSEAGEP